MSSLTRTQYLATLKLRSGILNSLSDAVLSEFLDAALRIYSGRLPKVKWSVDNTVVVDQELYDFPVDAVRIISVRVADTEQRVLWTTEDQGNGNKIKLGSVERKSYERLLKGVFYSDPLNFSVSEGQVGYEAFDVEYVALQTVATISDAALEILPLYIEYLGLNLKIDGAALAMAEGDSDTPNSITDTNADGSATTVSFDSPSKIVSSLEKRASEKLAQFNEMTQICWGTRG